jgi:DNA-binding beta-propeller fold protein YncE
MAADADGGRLYIPEAGGADAIVAIDAKGGKVVRQTSKGLWPLASATFAPDCDRLIISDGLAQISLYEGSLTFVGVVKNLVNAGCVGYDPVSKLAYVGYGAELNRIAVVDPEKPRKLDDIELDGYPIRLQLEAKGNRMFVSIPHMQQIAVIDRQKRAVVAIWPLQDPRWNFPLNHALTLDEEHHRLFVGCWNPAKLIVIDTDTGKIVSTVDCCPNVCDVFYDAQRKRIYASGDQYVSVFKETDPNTYKIVGSVATGSRGNTSLFVPATRKLYVVTEEPKTEVTKILVFDCGTDAAPTTAPAAAPAK